MGVSQRCESTARAQLCEASLLSHLISLCVCVRVRVCGRTCILHLSVWTINLNLCVQHFTSLLFSESQTMSLQHLWWGNGLLTVTCWYKIMGHHQDT